MKIRHAVTKFRMAGLVAALALLTTARAHAQWSVTPYVWTAGLGVDVALDGNPVVDQHIAFTDLVKDVKLAAMIRVEAQYGRVGGMLDLFYIQMKTEGSEVRLPDGTPATLDSKLDMAVIDGTASLALRPDGQGLALYAGTRVLVEGTDLDLTIPTGPGTGITKTSTELDALFNGLVGLRYRGRIAPRLSLEARSDVGAGDVKLTWSAGGEVAYAFSPRYALSLGYRYLAIEFKDAAPVESSITMSGALAGFRITF